MRLLLILAACACAAARPSSAQAPATGPLALLLPASTRAMALGNAGVTGRDDDVLFYNPAQLVGARGGFNTTLARYGTRSTLGAMTSSFTGGPLTLGWGVQVVNYSTRSGELYPFAPAVLVDRGSVNALSLLAAVGAAMAYKGFRIGTAAKYAEDRLSAGSGTAATAPALHGIFVADVGVAHALWTGVAGLSIQNIGHTPRGGALQIDAPFQASLGWSATKQVGEFDVGVATQLSARKGWFSPGGGVEVGYGWIEGYALTLRAGARRPETDAEKPFGLGASLNADRLTLDYGLQFFDGAQTAHRLTIRWR
jgi:hypothetical protein